ncbi:phage antirepressor KilAC domain-containing protein, partial [Escherichia coli]|nr:phage antirepressor KilAC domain-containing protein [Escherichia coli]
DKGWDARKRAYCLKIQPAPGSFARNLIYSTKPFAAKLAEQKAVLENQLAIAAPKAEFVDNYVEASGLMGFREVAKLLGIKETDFRLFLLENGIMYRLAGKMTPYSHHLDAGRFSVKTGEAGNGHAFTQVKFTPKGVQWIAGLLAAWRATAA